MFTYRIFVQVSRQTLGASFNTFANKIVAPLFPAPPLNEYGLPPAISGAIGPS